MELNFVCFERCFRRGVWGGVGPITFTCTYTHTWCYAARDIFSCTYTHTSYYARDIFFYARDIFSCTYTHTSCYATDVFCCTCRHTSCVAIYIFSCIYPHIWSYAPQTSFLTYLHTSCYATNVLCCTYILPATLETSCLAHTQLCPVKPNGMLQVFKIHEIFKVQFLTWNDYGAVAPSTFDSKTLTTASAVVTPPGCLSFGIYRNHPHFLQNVSLFCSSKLQY